MKRGKIVIIDGLHKGKTVTIYSEQNTVWMSIPAGLSSKKINLTSEIAQVESATRSLTSKKKVLARSAVAGLAGADHHEQPLTLCLVLPVRWGQ